MTGEMKSSVNQGEVKRVEAQVRPEIERRFLVARLPDDYETYPNKPLKTGYLSTDEGIDDRIRQDGPTFERTTKSGTGRSKIEQTVALTEEEFIELWSQIEVGKDETRYFIPVEGGTAELKWLHGDRDEDKGEVEVEFETQADADNFKAPDWFGREITDDDVYTSKSLAVKGYPEEARLIGQEQ